MGGGPGACKGASYSRKGDASTWVVAGSPCGAMKVIIVPMYAEQGRATLLSLHDGL
jgi:hypothetical protein